MCLAEILAITFEKRSIMNMALITLDINNLLTLGFLSLHLLGLGLRLWGFVINLCGEI